MVSQFQNIRVAFQMDPMETVNIDGDTTFALAEVAQARGMELFEYGPQHLSYNEGREILSHTQSGYLRFHT